jgi:hypothetical protein
LTWKLPPLALTVPPVWVGVELSPQEVTAAV